VPEKIKLKKILFIEEKTDNMELYEFEPLEGLERLQNIHYEIVEAVGLPTLLKVIVVIITGITIAEVTKRSCPDLFTF